MVSAAVPAVDAAHVLVGLAVGTAIFAVVVAVTVVLMALLQAVLPATDSGAEAVHQEEIRATGEMDERAG